MTEAIHPPYSQVSPGMARTSVPSKTHSAPVSTPAGDATPDSPTAANAGGLADANALFNGFDIAKLPPILISCVAKLWPGSNGLFWEIALEKMPERIEHLMAKAIDTDVAGQHPDDLAVDRFAAAMKAKMSASRAKGRSGWNDRALCKAEELQHMLLEHIAKGDAVDVGNFAMMLFCRGDSTASETLTGGYDEALCARAYGAAWPKVKAYIDGLNAARAKPRNCDMPIAAGAAGQEGGAA